MSEMRQNEASNTLFLYNNRTKDKAALQQGENTPGQCRSSARAMNNNPGAKYSSLHPHGVANCNGDVNRMTMEH
jgi:hypothetical protein